MCIDSGFVVRVRVRVRASCVLLGPRDYPRDSGTAREGTRAISEVTASPRWDMIRLAHRNALPGIGARKSCQGNGSDIITAKGKGGREGGKPRAEKGENRLIRST